MHLDSWSLDTSPQGLSHTVWIPLQPMDHSSGVSCVIPWWPRREVVTESMLGLTPDGGDPREERYDRLLSGSPEVATSLMRCGDFMVWSPLTPHFTLRPRSRPSGCRYTGRRVIRLHVRAA
jgi:hypothetical protein